MNKKVYIIVLILFCMFITSCKANESKSVINTNIISNEFDKLTYEKNNIEYPLFHQMIVPTKKEVKNIYNIDLDYASDYAIKHSALMNESSLYIILKPKEGKETALTNELITSMENYENYWIKKDKTQSNLVKTRVTYIKNNYIICVISYDNTKILDTINNIFKDKKTS